MNPRLDGAFFTAALFTLFLVYSADRQPFPSKQFLRHLNCIAESGLQPYCDEFLSCNNLLPQAYFDAYETCRAEISTGGDGRCSDDEQLYFSRENRSKIHYCILDNVGPVSNGEENQLHPFLTCFDQIRLDCRHILEKENN
ncbi:uncharacterized protein TNCT_295291 [Trichonephila clavata]|uniref:Uncharacterized protein n=1 Tax=Trichonephila clavata TaxID=2740835 RepID=A0A8X6GQY3_TRICU|nr:uncharacterized protein TNCT_295291 [Trichonephila clavata]